MQYYINHLCIHSLIYSTIMFIVNYMPSPMLDGAKVVRMHKL
jgi:hypothetical protein